MLDPATLEKIASKMVNPTSRPNTRLAQGYTYFGQFIAHDVLNPTNQNCVSRTVTEALNLDSLYGDFATGNEWRNLFDSGGMFLTNDFDLRRDPEGNAQIPEQRNDENIIIAQFHRLWLEVHNTLVGGGFVDGSSVDEIVTNARKLLILTYQILTVTDFLDLVLDEDVYNQYFRENRTYLLPKLDRIPSLFNHAAFRFGHSLVRNIYNLTPGTPGVDLSLLLQGRRNSKVIPDALKIDWDTFFGDRAGRAFQIDPAITEKMGRVPDCEDPTIDLNMAIQNLRAGNSLPSGIELVTQLRAQSNWAEMEQALQISDLTELSVFENINNLDIGTLPLWPYILLEARQRAAGRRLGPLGSTICAETFRWMIESADISIYQDGCYDPARTRSEMGRWGALLFGDESHPTMAGLLQHI